MNSYFAFALFCFSAVAFGAALPTAPMQCPENELFKPCGSACAPTCNNPHPGPACTRQCVIGCFCKDGYLRNSNGICVESNKCDEKESAPTCMDENEEYLQCKGCDGTCDNPNPICPRICVSGCACKKDHVRDINGRCMPVTKCPIQQQPQQEAIEIVLPTCVGKNEEFRSCRKCDGTCDKPNPICPRSFRICRPGCSCKEGHVRDANGECMPLSECPAPKVASFVIPEESKCPQNEIFRSCGTACPPSCADPHPSPICTRQCVIGCFCQQGFLRNAKGVCVPAANCEA